MDFEHSEQVVSFLNFSEKTSLTTTNVRAGRMKWTVTVPMHLAEGKPTFLWLPNVVTQEIVVGRIYSKPCKEQDVRATYLYGTEDIRVDTVPDPSIIEATDAIVRVVLACVCGSDLHRYRDFPASDHGRPMGHELVGVVEQVGSAVRYIKPGDFVICPFTISDNTCEFCAEGVHTACQNVAYFGTGSMGGAQADLARIPHADGTLVAVPGIDENSELLPSLLSLSDVYATGYHAAHVGHVEPGKTVAVIGDGAVGLSAVLASCGLGADRVILLSHHEDRAVIGSRFGATDIVTERGDAAVSRVLELTEGHGAHVVIEAVGYKAAYEQAYKIARSGGVVSRVGLPQYDEAPIGWDSLFARNISLAGGPAPVRAYIEALIPKVLSGEIDPGLVFDRVVSLDDVAKGYQLMSRREALKVMVRP